jgi:hypothetical protein
VKLSELRQRYGEPGLCRSRQGRFWGMWLTGFAAQALPAADGAQAPFERVTHCSRGRGRRWRRRTVGLRTRVQLRKDEERGRHRQQAHYIPTHTHTHTLHPLHRCNSSNNANIYTEPIRLRSHAHRRRKRLRHISAYPSPPTNITTTTTTTAALPARPHTRPTRRGLQPFPRHGAA